MPRPGWLACIVAILAPGPLFAQPEPPVAVDSETIPVTRRPQGRWWFDGSFDFGWMSNRTAPSAVRLTPPDLAGRRVPPIILPLNGALDASPNLGLQLFGGLWLTENQVLGVEFGLGGLLANDQRIDGFAPGTLVFFPNGPDRSAPLFLRFPDTLAGLASPVPATASKWFGTAEANVRLSLWSSDWLRFDLLGGYRFAYLQDELYLGASPEQTSNGDWNDYSNNNTESNSEYRLNRLTTENSFHGGQIGAEAEVRAGALSVLGTFKIAYGGVTSRTSATGAFNYPDMPLQVRSDRRSAYMPVVRVKVGLDLTEGLVLYAGYNFTYLSHATRLGDAFSDTGPTWNPFWAHSVSLGLELRF